MEEEREAGTVICMKEMWERGKGKGEGEKGDRKGTNAAGKIRATGRRRACVLKGGREGGREGEGGRKEGRK